MTGADAGENGSGRYPAGTIGFYSWNVQENRLHGDEVIAHIYGIPMHELAEGAPIEMVIRHLHEADKRRVAKAIHTAIVTGERYEAEYRLTHPDGRTLRITANGCCLRDVNGTPSIYTGTATILPLQAAHGAIDPLEVHCRAALGIATKRRHALAARYLSSALNVIGKQN